MYVMVNNFINFSIQTQIQQHQNFATVLRYMPKEKTELQVSDASPFLTTCTTL
jgi:hypothetical protein